MVVAGIAAPLVRKRVNAPPALVQAVAFGAPVGLCVAMRRSPARDVAACSLQMWAYLAAYKSPHDDPAAQELRVHVGYPIVADRMLGLGELPNVRLQRALARSGPAGAEWRAAGPGAGVGALELVRRPARLAGLPAAASPRAVRRARRCSPTRCSTSARASTG